MSAQPPLSDKPAPQAATASFTGNTALETLPRGLEVVAEGSAPVVEDVLPSHSPRVLGAAVEGSRPRLEAERKVNRGTWIR